MSRSEADFRGSRDDVFRQLLEDCDGEEAKAFLCRGNYDQCRKHITGRRKKGQPTCQWCACIHITPATTVDDLYDAIALDA
ncbi:hypothetical protein [Methylobacterium sp. 285MFTsu5.1]|uniref:hypothetical protein n=1 Tax=Methylobacterium sp. 285MFTsu5.1 TaxID=1172187 RepID=UPI000360C790|nr:hypothetical protein [Methylobacterium sp. 285MFTsu5.1]